jgi:5-methyltetrahydrofolate--homocysteine methyltransferase
MPGYVRLAAAFAAALADTGIQLLAEPNAGQPELNGDTAVYTLSPKDFADAQAQIAAVGATILGGCCGTTPAHIAATVKKLNR